MQIMKLLKVVNRLDKRSMQLLKDSASGYFELCILFKEQEFNNTIDKAVIYDTLSKLIKVTDELSLKLSGSGLDLMDFIKGEGL